MKEINKLDLFDGVQAPSFRNGKKAPLKVNLEQTLAIKLGSRKVESNFSSMKGKGALKGAFFIYPFSKGDFSELPVSQSPNIFKKRRDLPFQT